MGMDFAGDTFRDRFLIADVRAELPFSHERHFHFDPPWNPGRQVLLHPQPDGVWRIDWQVPPETDADAERDSGALDRRIRAVLGPSTPYELVWVTGYRFSQRVAGAFRAGRVFLAGDAAHVMSPFGARGLNSGVADAENLAWKLALVVRGDAPPPARHVRRRAPAGGPRQPRRTGATMRFMAPHGPIRRAWRDLVLRMASRSAWFRRRVDSGRLAEPATYAVIAVMIADPRARIWSLPMCRCPTADGFAIGWGGRSSPSFRTRLARTHASSSSTSVPTQPTDRIGPGSSGRTVTSAPAWRCPTRRTRPSTHWSPPLFVYPR